MKMTPAVPAMSAGDSKMSTIKFAPHRLLSLTFYEYANWLLSTHSQEPFRRMPNKLLGKIIEDCGPSYALRVGTVCRRWRRVAWSTPKLWTTIDIRLNDSRSLKPTLVYSREWLNRSGQLPLTIHFTAAKVPSLLTIEMNTVIELINEYAHRSLARLAAQDTGRSPTET